MNKVQKDDGIPAPRGDEPTPIVPIDTRSSFWHQPERALSPPVVANHPLVSRKAAAGLAAALTLILGLLAPLGDHLTGSMLGTDQLDRIEAQLVEVNARLDRVERVSADSARLSESHEHEIAMIRSRQPVRLPASLRSIVAGDDLRRDVEEAQP